MPQIGLQTAPTPPMELEYEVVLEQIGFGRTQWMLLWISGLLTVTSISAQTSVSIISIASQCEFAMSQADKGIMMTACVTGVFLSTYFWGYVSDAVGRRVVLLVSAFLTSLLQFVTIFVTSAWLFNLINLFMGISLGGISGAIYAYIGEFNTNKYRAIVINYSTMFVSVSSIYVPAVAWLVISTEWSVTLFSDYTLRAWRLLILASLLPGLLGAILLLPFPESPKLLLAQGKLPEALVAVDWISQRNRRLPLAKVLGVAESDLVLKADELPAAELDNSGVGAVVRSIWQATVPLFRKPHGRNFMVCVAVVFGLFFTSGMANWFPEIVNRSTSVSTSNSSETICNILDKSFAMARSAAANVTGNTPINECSDKITTRTYVDSMIVGSVNLVGFLVQGVILNPLGRRNVLMGTVLITIVSGLLMYIVSSSLMLLTLFCLFIVMPALSISVMCGVAVDIMPTNLRAKAVSICFTLGRLGIVVALNFIGIMLEHYCRSMFTVFIVIVLICLVLIRTLPM